MRGRWRRRAAWQDAREGASSPPHASLASLPHPFPLASPLLIPLDLPCSPSLASSTCLSRRRRTARCTRRRYASPAPLDEACIATRSSFHGATSRPATPRRRRPRPIFYRPLATAPAPPTAPSPQLPPLPQPPRHTAAPPTAASPQLPPLPQPPRHTAAPPMAPSPRGSDCTPRWARSEWQVRRLDADLAALKARRAAAAARGEAAPTIEACAARGSICSRPYPTPPRPAEHTRRLERAQARLAQIKTASEDVERRREEQIGKHKQHLCGVRLCGNPLRSCVGCDLPWVPARSPLISHDHPLFTTLLRAPTTARCARAIRLHPRPGYASCPAAELAGPNFTALTAPCRVHACAQVRAQRGARSRAVLAELGGPVRARRAPRLLQALNDLPRLRRRRDRGASLSEGLSHPVLAGASWMISGSS